MQTAGNILAGIGREITAGGSGAPPISVADSSRINALKRRFADVAQEICPGFEFTSVSRDVVIDIFNWCCMLPGNLNPDKGLCLWGNVGTGKSTMLRIVKEFTKRLGIRRLNGCPSFRISHAADDVSANYEEKGLEGIQTFVESRAQAFDDVGSETIPTGHYGTNCNVMQRILQSRYDRRFSSLTHMTTNFTKADIVTVYGDRCYDRCKEMFNFIEFKGRTLRKEK